MTIGTITHFVSLDLPTLRLRHAEARAHSAECLARRSPDRPGEWDGLSAAAQRWGQVERLCEEQIAAMEQQQADDEIEIVCT